jgi:hypothetical protein
MSEGLSKATIADLKNYFLQDRKVHFLGDEFHQHGTNFAAKEPVSPMSSSFWQAYGLGGDIYQVFPKTLQGYHLAAVP